MLRDSIYVAGDRFHVLADHAGDADPCVGKVGIFTGRISVEDGQVTHLWLAFPEHAGDIGYNIKQLIACRDSGCDPDSPRG